MTESADELPADQLPAAGSVVLHQSRTLAVSKIHSFVEEDLSLAGPDGPMPVTRSFVSSMGAVAVLAVDDSDRVACVRQYRHPVGRILVEPPAGLLDHADEDPLAAAQRELAEEVMVAADHWSVLVDVSSTPGGSTEQVRIFLATGLRPAARPEGFELYGEEATMEVVWYRLDELTEAILAGRVTNPSLTAGVLALVTARATGASLRDPASPWPARDVIRPRVHTLIEQLRPTAGDDGPGDVTH